MEIRLIYSTSDPQQLALREFLNGFLRERGVMADLHEADVPATSEPTIIINGEAVMERRLTPRTLVAPLQQRLEYLAGALERHCWSF